MCHECILNTLLSKCTEDDDALGTMSSIKVAYNGMHSQHGSHINHNTSYLPTNTQMSENDAQLED